MGSVDLSEFQGDAGNALDVVEDEDDCLCDVDRHDLGCFEHYEVGDR